MKPRTTSYDQDGSAPRSPVCPPQRARARRAPGARIAILLAMALAIAVPLRASLNGAPAIEAASDTVIASEGLASGWANWSWSSSIDFNYTGGAYQGSRATSWWTNAAWAGLYLHTDKPVPTTASTTLQFAVWGGAGNLQLRIGLYGDGNQAIAGSGLLAALAGAPPANAWKLYTIPLSSLGGAGRNITGVQIQDARGVGGYMVILDEIKLVGVAGSVPVPTPTPGGGTSTNCSAIPAYPEIRQDNYTANHTAGRRTDPNKFVGVASFRPYYDKIDGNCTGTTEQILEWAAKKWGFDQLGYPDLAKAQAVVESWWHQSTVGNSGEVGILQVNPNVWPDWDPARWSTAYAADYAMAVIRSHYDGNSWLGSQTKGNLRDAVAAWECGCAYNGGNWYATRVFNYYSSKPWKNPGQPPEWF